MDRSNSKIEGLQDAMMNGLEVVALTQRQEDEFSLGVSGMDRFTDEHSRGTARAETV